MDGGTTEHQAGAEGLGEVGGDSKKGRGVTQSCGNILQGGDTNGAPIWLGDLVPIVVNG